jgi:acyl-homoserine lactone acylase PvdQ
VTIYRDAYGVAHVYGRSDADAAFGFAYVQAEDNFWQVEENYIRALGRAAEVDGERALFDDWLNRALEVVRLSKEEYAQSDARLRALLDGYAAGFNHYLATHPEVTPRLLDRFEPWYPLALIRFLYYQNGFAPASGLRRSEAMDAL